MILIGITGSAGSGKDSLADKIINKYSGAIKIAFADPLKLACKELFQLSCDQLYVRQEKEKIDPRWNKSPRELFQIIGSDLLRDRFDEDIFIKSTREKIKKLSQEHKIIIVTDCRFENETQLIRDMGGIVIHLKRPNIKRINDHISENPVKIMTGDIELVNNSTIDKLLEEIKIIFIV